MPLPRFLQDSKARGFFGVISKPRDRTIFRLMLSCGLRVEDADSLTLGAVDHRRNQLMVRCGKGARDRLVYLYYDDAADVLAGYL